MNYQDYLDLNFFTKRMVEKYEKIFVRPLIYSSINYSTIHYCFSSHIFFSFFELVPIFLDQATFIN